MQTTIHKKNTWPHTLFWVIVGIALIMCFLMDCNVNAESLTEEARGKLEKSIEDAPLKSFKISEVTRLKIENLNLQVLSLLRWELWHNGISTADADKYIYNPKTNTFVRR